MRVLIVFGTRPEAIKLVPLIKEFQKYDEFEVKICVTAQHREMLDQVLNTFKIEVDYDLNIMKSNQNLYNITADILNSMKEILDDFKPKLVVVHGDTTTTFSVSLASFYQKIDVVHIEAGLRTHNIYNPFPEEANRKLTSVLAKYHFSPTNLAKQNLINENIKENIFVVGNSVIDTLKIALNKANNFYFKKKYNFKKFILVTSHRRENFGKIFEEICKALKMIATKNRDIDIIFPVHLNPNIQKTAYKLLKWNKNIHLIQPVEYLEFIYLMNKSYFILTDSGGIQEEASFIAKPVLLMREVTEREKLIKNVKLVGTKKINIVKESLKLLNNPKSYNQMAKKSFVYGKGDTAKKIVKILKEKNEKKNI